LWPTRFTAAGPKRTRNLTNLLLSVVVSVGYKMSALDSSLNTKYSQKPSKRAKKGDEYELANKRGPNIDASIV